MTALCNVLCCLTVSSLFIMTQTEHHEIPIISNNSAINNSFTITNFMNLTEVFNGNSAAEVEVYDDGVALMDDYVLQEESSLEDDGHQVTDTSDNSFDKDEEEDSDFTFLANRARWSYLPKFVESMCRQECQAKGKPFGRLLGTRCQCYCPLNAPTLNLCATSKSCDGYCSSIGFSRGGDCVYNNVCFCYCRKSEPYDVRQVHTA